jgi:glycosyltransferase involved in cell wall biosynthesis
MKISMIGQKGIPTTFGGVERSVEALAVRLGAMGHDVRVYTRAWYAVANPNFSPGVRTIETPTIRTKNLDAIVHTFTSTVHALLNGTEVFHYHGVGPALLAWIPRVFAPHAKVVVTFQCIDSEHQKWGAFARLMLTLGERAACLFPHETIVVSRTLEAYCKEKYGAETRYIPNGVSTPDEKVGTDRLAALGLEKDGYVAMVSRLVRHKGAHHLIAAYADDYVAELKELAKDMPDIVFTGNLSGDDLAQAFSGAYAIVHPSESEGLPMSVLEAMSYGKTVIASDIPEHMEVIRDHGVPFRNKSVMDLARKLKYALAHPESVASTGRGAKAFIMENYHWDDIAQSVNGIYRELAAASDKDAAKRAAKKVRAAA